MIEDEFKVIFNKFKIEEVTKFEMDYGDFDDLVREYLPGLVAKINPTIPDRYKNFECIAEFEWNNYSNYDVEVSKNDLKDDSIYNKFDRKEIIDGKLMYLSFHSIVCFLIEHKVLPLGNYEVRVSW